MKITATILILLVAIEAILFMVLEIWGGVQKCCKDHLE